MIHQLLVLASGPFGKDVAGRLRHGALERGHDITLQEIDEGTHPSLWPHADLILLATSHERPRICEAVDEAAFAWRVPWFGVHTTATKVLCGPVVIPGRTACHDCYIRRRAQHERPGHSTAVTGDRYPTGYPVHHVGIAAAFAQQAVDEVLRKPDDEGAIGGTVRTFDQINGSTSRSPVVAVDRCPRCRTRAKSDELWRRLASINEGRRV
ncbi:bacteriocin biosynthesis cyclodehydratase domain-containing protein [Streptomyces sp. SceaMP-e96]|uniref:TOMM precursor leader peptide-binding protein n=1 Tax=unclassified Streptomyces TaxID=2593676 RepID=UPI000823E921|nr:MULTISPECIES: TOMM precursor leader peptide-binding protein [unclassified Streptomyces]MYT15721.1 TOMM precursor leader peptide-binding protein [Streptomyces sp. SID4951]SCK24107.1 bacteriocin biosynthesis cyclodehydratase domain-containing protein [Streptomyces sp. SceaMP-e96]